MADGAWGPYLRRPDIRKPIARAPSTAGRMTALMAAVIAKTNMPTIDQNVRNGRDAARHARELDRLSRVLGGDRLGFRDRLHAPGVELGGACLSHFWVTRSRSLYEKRAGKFVARACVVFAGLSTSEEQREVQVIHSPHLA